MAREKRDGASHEQWLRSMVGRAAERDRQVGSGDTYDFGVTLARIVYRETMAKARARIRELEERVALQAQAAEDRDRMLVEVERLRRPLADKHHPCERCGGNGIEPWVHLTTVTMRLETVSEANTRGEGARMARKKNQKQVVTDFLCARLRPDFGPAMVRTQGPLRVVLVRGAPRKLDGDNLASSLKACRDAVAKWLGVDDGDEDRVVWETKQNVRSGMMTVAVEFYRRRSCGSAV